MPRELWLAVLRPLSSRRQAALWVASFILPLLVWSIVSYVPFVWHPLVKVEAPGDVEWFKEGQLIPREDFAREAAKVAAAGGHVPQGHRSNPIFLPAPHEVGRALYTAFTTKPILRGDAWLHESLWLSIQTIFWGFVVSSAIGVPLGILCGSFAALARITEPLVDFVRYMPAPAFGALMVAIFGIYQQPKIAIIFIGTFFQQVLVIANTVRKVDPALLEAAQTLGAKRHQLVWNVIVPASMPDLYNDLRILLGWAWTYLIVAEVVGISSGITFFINQQAKYRNFDNVYAAILIIGIIGLATDQVLAYLGRHFFGWRTLRPSKLRAMLRRAFAGRTIPAPAEAPKGGGL